MRSVAQLKLTVELEAPNLNTLFATKEASPQQNFLIWLAKSCTELYLVWLMGTRTKPQVCALMAE
jgi:hypothetical protein